MPNPPKNLASLTEAAEYVGCAPRTIRRRISEGTLTGYRFGTKMLRVDLTEVDALIRPVPAAGRPA